MDVWNMPFFTTLVIIIAVNWIRAPILSEHTQQLLLWYEHWTKLLQNHCILAGILKMNLFFLSCVTLILNNENVLSDWPEYQCAISWQYIWGTEKYFCLCVKCFFNYFWIRWVTFVPEGLICQHGYGWQRKCHANNCIMLAKILLRRNRSKGNAL